jgi:hypothetical protein
LEKVHHPSSGFYFYRTHAVAEVERLIDRVRSRMELASPLMKRSSFIASTSITRNAFSEHGAIQAANVLSSTQAVEMASMSCARS